MARARNIKPKFFTNQELVELPFSTRLLFIGLWTLADRAGRMEDKPKRIKMEIFPADNVDVDAALNELQSAGLIQRYAANGTRYLAVLAFLKHQNPHHKEAASTIPEPEALPALHKHKASDSGGNEGGSNLGQASDFGAVEGGVNRADSLIPDSLNRIPDSGLSDSLNPESGKERTASARKPAFQMLGFNEFWLHYPRKGKKPATEEQWSLLSPDPDLRVTILASLEDWKQSRQWSDKNFIPMPEKWLKQRQWEDEVPRETTSNGGAASANEAAVKTWLDGSRPAGVELGR